MGDAFRKIMSESWDYTINNETAFPVCIAQAGIKFHIDFDDLVDFYIQSFISNLINMCVKHIPLSQKDGKTYGSPQIFIISGACPPPAPSV